MKLEVGKKYVCRDKSNVKYVEIKDICIDLDEPDSAYGIGYYIDGALKCFSSTWTLDGKGRFIEYDLVAEYKEPPQREVWINLYQDSAYAYFTKEDAKLHRDPECIARKKVIITEREWDE